MKKQLFLIFTVLTFFAPQAPSESIRYPVGEQLSYRILWGFLPVGRTTVTCEKISENDTPRIRIRVEAKSTWLVSTLYPVDDRIDCYIDPVTGLPLRVEKKTSEGNHRCDDTLWLDHENLLAQWESRSASITTNYLIKSDTLDVGAFLYALRSLSFELNDSKSFNIAVDGLLHGLKITAEEKKPIKMAAEKKKVHCTRFSVVPDRTDLFVRKIPSDIWVTDDSRRIMVKMKTKTPVGHVRIVLDEIRMLP